FFFSSRRRHTRFSRDWSSDVCSSDLQPAPTLTRRGAARPREACMADPRPVLEGLSSMATRQVLSALASGALAAGLSQVRITSVGGVDAEKRVMDGEPVDLVWLAAPALERLEAAGHLVPGSR